MNNIQKITTPKRIVAFILLFSQMLMSCENFNTLRRDEIRPIEKKINKQNTNLDKLVKEDSKEKQILPIVVDSEHLLAEQFNPNSPSNNEIVYLISDGRNEAEENRDMEVNGENTSQQFTTNPVQLPTREADRVSSAIELATQQCSALLTSRIIQKGEERAKNTLDQQKSLSLYRHKVKKRQKEDKLINQRTVTDNELSNLALSPVKEPSSSNQSKKEVEESTPFILYTKDNHQVCFNHPDDKQVKVIADIPTALGTYPPLYLPVIHLGFQLDIKQLATYPIKYQQNRVHICFPVNDPNGIGYVRIEDSGLKGGGRISIDGYKLIQAIVEGYGTLDREAETLADWSSFLGNFAGALSSVDLALTPPSNSTSFDPGNMRNMFLHMARSITNRNIQLENYGEAWSSIVNQARDKIRQVQSLNIDPADYPRDSYTIVLRPNASKMRPFIGEMDSIYLTSVGGNVNMDFNNILGAVDVEVILNASFYEFENKKKEREENERKDRVMKIVYRVSEEVENIESNFLKIKSKDIKKAVNELKLQHEELMNKLSILDDLPGADEETRAKRKSIVQKVLALLDETDKLLKQGQEEEKEKERVDRVVRSVFGDLSHKKEVPQAWRGFPYAFSGQALAPQSSSTTEMEEDNLECIEFGPDAKSEAVSIYSRRLLASAARASNNPCIYITSTARDAVSQAYAMFNNLERDLAEQRRTYRAPGQAVIDVYVNMKANKASALEIKDAMVKKINELGPSNVSPHCADSNILNVVDIFIARLSNSSLFKSTIEEYPGVKLLNENKVFHVEIKQP